MTDLKKVINDVISAFDEWENNTCCPGEDWSDVYQSKDMVIALLKAQEPHIITKKDFKNNPSVDENGYLPAYCEKIDRPIGWMAIHKGYIGARKDIRYWTGKPTDEQREAVKWNDA